MSHERLERTLKMNRTRFKRRTGIYPETFYAMESVLDRTGKHQKEVRATRGPQLSLSNSS